jgi:hypothetical protein
MFSYRSSYRNQFQITRNNSYFPLLSDLHSFSFFICFPVSVFLFVLAVDGLNVDLVDQDPHDWIDECPDKKGKIKRILTIYLSNPLNLTITSIKGKIHHRNPFNVSFKMIQIILTIYLSNPLNLTITSIKGKIHHRNPYNVSVNMILLMFLLK